jgi:protocatechuate 3,4-dioxygenase alpha subunit
MTSEPKLAQPASFGQTPSQTVGPYFAFGLTPEQYGYAFRSIAGGQVASYDEPGEHIRIIGRVFDGGGKTIEDALIETWQADASGRYAHPVDGRGSNSSFRGFGRVGTGTDPEHRFVFSTVKPGSVDGLSAPHINVTVLMRGMLLHAYTRIYFSDEVSANARDPVLSMVPAERRRTLIAERVDMPSGPFYRFDIHMQGPTETVFFDV